MNEILIWFYIHFQGIVKTSLATNDASKQKQLFLIFYLNVNTLAIFLKSKSILNLTCHKFFCQVHLLSNISKTNIGMRWCGKKGKFMSLNLPEGK